MHTSRRTFAFTLLRACALAAKPRAEIALAGGKIITSPNAPPIPRGALIVRDGRIVAVGPVKTSARFFAQRSTRRATLLTVMRIAVA